MFFEVDVAARSCFFQFCPRPHNILAHVVTIFELLVVLLLLPLD